MDKNYRVSYSTESGLTTCNLRFTDCEYHDTLANAIWANRNHRRQGRMSSIFRWEDKEEEYVELAPKILDAISRMLRNGMEPEEIASIVEKDLKV